MATVEELRRVVKAYRRAVRRRPTESPAGQE